MSYDLNIDEARAKHWIEEVNHEIALVKELLIKVSTASTTTPQEEDDIMRGIQNTCDIMQGFWKNMCKGFSDATGAISNAIQEMVKATTESVENINSVGRNVGTR